MTILYQIFYHCLHIQLYDVLKGQNVKFVAKGLYYGSNVGRNGGRGNEEREKGGQGGNRIIMKIIIVMKRTGE